MKRRMISLVLVLVLIIGCLPIAASATPRTADEAINWASSKVGQAIDYDGMYGAQCVDLILAYYNYLGVATVSGNGKDYAWNDLPSGWSRVQGGAPQKGDILVYSGTSDNGYNGHVAIYESDYVHYDQNIVGHYGVVRCTWHYNYNGNYWGYIRPNWSDTPSTPTNITLDDPWVDNINDTGATIHSVIRNNRQRVQAYGLEVWEKSTKKNVIDHWENIPSNYQTLNYIDIWVNTIDELGVSLKPGTEYGCFFYIDEGGKVFSKETYFKTTGAGAPSISKLAISKKEVLIGESITFTCTSDTATGYTLGINRGSTRVLTQEVTNGSFTTSFAEPGEYSAYVSAYNDTGMLDSAKVYFIVKNADGTPPAPSSGFVDVPHGAYFTDAVQWAVDNGVTSGTSATTFSPNASCTRGQAVTFLWRAAGEPEPTGNKTGFHDVNPDAYYEKAVRWAVEQRITSGTSTTTFSPNAKCTRAQIVTFLWRAENMPSASGSTFSDVGANAYYSGAVSWAVSGGVTSGTSTTTFSPNSKCTRGQIVTFLYRASKL